MPEDASPFAATASAMGYLYQLRIALLRCTDLLEGGASWTVALEAGDDIECVQDGTTGLWQLKHRAEGTRITDGTTDLWKSLRVWASGVAAAVIDLDSADLFLLTTADAPPLSAAAYLGPGHQSRDPSEAHRLLTEARSAARARQKKKAAANPDTEAKKSDLYGAWDSLPEPEQLRLLERVQILHNAEDIHATGTRLQGRVAIAVGHQCAGPFLERLEGWFFQRTIAQMGTAAGPITGTEFDEAFSRLRSQFRPDNLPIDDDVIDLSGESDLHTDKMFVQQMGLARIGSTRVRIAVREWLRASTQRDRWSNENLLLPGEIARYERRLTEEWEVRFEAMRDELGDQAAGEAMTAAAKALYRWVEQEARFPIRRGCEEPFITTGSFHMLADDLDVGWHPQYAARLMTLLEPAGSHS
ncbi:ABC-three component system protein [Streptomyces sp. NPDC091265]|uniref:ABC-three component system protein n=1 Tax=unclassified Streptomyces TaxID=2593676 RepID=UPI00344BFD5E